MPDSAFRDRVHRPQGWVPPVLTAGGLIAGTWRHERKGSNLDVTVAPFRRLGAAVRRAAGAAAQRLESFLGGTRRLHWE